MLENRNKKQIYLLSVIVILLTLLTLQFTVFSKSPKSTLEILKNISSKNQTDFYGVIENLPKFDATKHSDGCSGGMSATYAQLKVLHNKYGSQLPWRHCCVSHDKAYYYGGDKEKKLKADTKLKNCIAATIGDVNLGLVLGNFMEKTVNIGGLPYFPTSYRWGYGEDFKALED